MDQEGFIELCGHRMRLLSHCRTQSQTRPWAQVRELTDQEGFVEHCAGVAADEDLEPTDLQILLNSAIVPDAGKGADGPRPSLGTV